ncbi:MAG: hypothetical protein OXF44_06470 [Anaerolineaceae bacterium]|nr:hypothetical protein [Anaerolineaceae bacterium]MCY4021956.1 hypothetical protein [Anaerolineaceae bacterium]
MDNRKLRHALLAFVLLLVQLGALQQLTNIPPELVAQLSLVLPLELVLTLAWALIFAWLAVNLWRGLPARRLWQALTVYAVTGVLRLLVFARADYHHGRTPVLLFALLLAALVLFRYRTESRREPGT